MRTHNTVKVGLALSLLPTPAFASGDVMFAWIGLWYIGCIFAAIIFLIFSRLPWNRRLAIVLGLVLGTLLTIWGLIEIEPRDDVTMLVFSAAPVFGFLAGFVWSKRFVRI